MMKHASCTKCTKEEIKNCNIDIQCLFNYVLDENGNLKALVEKLEKGGDEAVGVVGKYSIHKHWANIFILSHIFNIFDLTGYNRQTTPGIRIWQTAPLYSPAEHSSEQDGSGNENELDERIGMDS